MRRGGTPVDSSLELMSTPATTGVTPLCFASGMGLPRVVSICWSVGPIKCRMEGVALNFTYGRNNPDPDQRLQENGRASARWQGSARKKWNRLPEGGLVEAGAEGQHLYAVGKKEHAARHGPKCVGGIRWLRNTSRASVPRGWKLGGRSEMNGESRIIFRIDSLG